MSTNSNSASSRRFTSVAHLQSLILSSLAAAVLAVSVLATSPAQAQVTSVAGDVVAVSQADVIAVGSVEENAYTSDTEIRVFLEKQDVVLTTAMVLDIIADGTYGTPLSPGTVAAGQKVTSVMIHTDRATVGGISNLIGTIEFNTDILGIVLEDGTLDTWDTVVGVGSIDYPGGLQYRGMETDAATYTYPDEIVVAGNRLELNLNTSSWVDQLRVIFANNSRGVSFSIDAHGPSIGALPAFGPGPMRAGDILTPGAAGAPGPNRPVLGPTMPPGVMLEPTDLGVMVYGLGDVKEIDALSYGHDRGRRLRFSVDEYAIGTAGIATVNVFSEGAIGNQEASADVFAYRAPLAPAGPAFTPGNVAVLDGDGVAPTGRPGFGLIEPNPPTPGTAQDDGDNLDALDLDTSTADLSGRVYFSLDGTFRDWAEASMAAPPNYGTAAANGVNGADVLASIPGSGMFYIYATAGALGLGCNGECEDDIDALIINDNGDGEYNANDDKILFSLRRGSATLGTLDTRLGLPITEADVLAPGPAIYLTGESLGLDTGRWGVNSPYQVPDDLDALDTIHSRGAPVSQNDEASASGDQIVVIDVLANDAALLGHLDPGSVAVFAQPQFGEIVWINSQSGEIHYRFNSAAAATDEFSYLVRDDQGRFSEVATVSIVTGVTDVGDDHHTGRQTIFAFAGPNPMHDKTSFRLAPARSGHVSVAIFDLAGHKVRTLLDGVMQAGEVRELAWNGRDDSGRSTATGMYFVRLKSPDGGQMLRVIRMK